MATHLHALVHQHPIWLTHSGHSMYIYRGWIWCHAESRCIPLVYFFHDGGVTFPGCSSLKDSVCAIVWWKSHTHTHRSTKMNKICELSSVIFPVRQMKVYYYTFWTLWLWLVLTLPLILCSEAFHSENSEYYLMCQNDCFFLPWMTRLWRTLK